MKRYFIEISYKGTHYNGWQKQPNAITVQQLLDSKLSLILGEETETVGTGRTDTGVHARHFTAHFDHSKTISAEFCDKMVYKLNRMLPHDIAVFRIKKVKDDAHARFSAISRSYEYHICREKDPFLHNFSWVITRAIDYNLLQESAALLLDYNDFECFSKTNTQVKNYLCQLSKANWRKQDNVWIFSIESNRFLRNMIRSIVGTMVSVGLGKITTEEFRNIIESKKRPQTGVSAPGSGLYFMGAQFDPGIYEDN